MFLLKEMYLYVLEAIFSEKHEFCNTVHVLMFFSHEISSIQLRLKGKNLSNLDPNSELCIIE